MARPIEPTPVLTAEEWEALMQKVRNVKSKPLRFHEVDVSQIRAIMKDVMRKRNGRTK